MSVDVKEVIGQLEGKISASKELQKLFKDQPIKVVEEVLGADLPDDLVEKVIDGVKAKMTVDDLAEAAGFLKKLF